MTYYTVEPDDSLDGQWLFFRDDERGKLVVRNEYADLVCRSCGKFDEHRAIDFGISPSFQCRTDRDLVGTSEGWLCASSGMRKYVEECEYGGLTFVPVPQSPHFVVYPAVLVETDEELAAFENHRRCHACGRYSERIVGPVLAGMRIPSSSTTFFGSAIANENVKVAYRPIFASGEIVESLRSRGFVGVDFVSAH
jgi:hypothetical protein